MIDEVIIAGGGIAGLSTAVALHRAGCTAAIKVLEAATAEDFGGGSTTAAVAAAPPAAAAAAVQLTPNGLRALEAIGGTDLLQRILRHSSVCQHNVMILPSNNSLYDNLYALPPFPPKQQQQQQQQQGSATAAASTSLPTVMIRWHLLRQFLVELLPANTVLYNQKIVAVNSSSQPEPPAHDTNAATINKNQTIQFTLQDCSSGKHTAVSVSTASTLIVAADGKNSVFRPTPLVSSRRVNLKAVISTHNSPSAVLLSAESTTYSLFSPTGIACFLGPAGAGGWQYWGVSIPVASDEEEAWYCHYASQRQNEVLKTKLIDILEAWNMPETAVFIHLIQATAAHTILLQVSSEAALPENFCLLDNVVLVGDAAHVMSASYGQCVSFALEDAATLSYCLSSSSSSSPTKALEEYSALRRERCLLMQRKSQERVAMLMKKQQQGGTGNNASIDPVTEWIHNWELPSPNTTIILKTPDTATADTPMEVVG